MTGRQAGSCRLSAILTTDAHMLKPQHLSSLVLIDLELREGLVEGLVQLFTLCLRTCNYTEGMNEFEVSWRFHTSNSTGFRHIH